MSVTMPSSMVNPAGLLIHAFTDTTRNEPTMPDMATGRQPFQRERQAENIAEPAHRGRP
jgi:hypothetical protein